VSFILFTFVRSNLKQYKMKMSQYNWSWWFVLTVITLVVGMLIAMVAKTEFEMILSNIILIVSLISFIPCLYIGMKPNE